MKKEKITFSSDDSSISREDLNETSKMAEEYFEMEQNSDQIPATDENRDWIFDNIPEYLNIIRNEGKIIGYVFLLPCSKDLMEKFLRKKITEARLFEEIKKNEFSNNPEAIYLCASVLRKEFRGLGLATRAFLKSIRKITKNGKNKPILFCWIYSSEGEKLVKRIANSTGIELRSRRNS